MARKIEVVIVGNSAGLERSFSRAATRSNALTRAFHALALAASAGVVIGLDKTVHAALNAESSQARLQQAFKNSHLSLRAYTGELTRTETASRKLGFTDNEVRDSLGSLITASGSLRKALVNLNVAQDLSRFKHVSLVDATKMLTMAMTGSQRAAKQLGIVVIPLTTNVDKLKAAHEKLTDAQRKATAGAYKEEQAHAKLLDKLALGQAVIDQVTKKTHGQADAFSKTAAGGLAKFRAELEHLEAELGRGLLPVLTGATEKLGGLFSAVETHMPQIRQEFGGLATAAAELGTKLGQLAISPEGSSLLLSGGAALGAGAAAAKIGTLSLALGALNPIVLGIAGVAGIATLAITNLVHSSEQADQHFKDLANDAKTLPGAMSAAVVAQRELTQAQITASTTARALAAAQELENQAIARFGRHSQQAKNAHDGVRQAALNHANALTSLKGAQTAYSQAAANHVATLSRLRSAMDKTVAGVQHLEAEDKAGYGSTIELNKQRNKAIATLVSLGESAAGAAPKLAAAALSTAALASALNRMPTHNEVDIFIRTFQVGKSPGSIGGRVRTRQHGGFVPGGMGEAVPIMAHAGEIVLNPSQQAALGGPRYLSELFGFAAGGVVSRHHKPKHRAPRLPGSIREAEARAAGTASLDDDIAAYTREENWISGQLRGKGLSASERESLKVKQIRVRNRIRSLRSRKAKAKASAKQRDYSTLPPRLQYLISKSHLTPSTADDLAALKQAEAYLVGQLKRPGLTYAQKTQIIDALVSVRDEIASIESDTGTAAGVDTADLEAQLAQSNERLAASQLGERLANAFVATGVFAGQGGEAGGFGGGGESAGGTTVIFQHLIPDAAQIAKATAAIATGAGRQGYRRRSRQFLGV